LTAVTRLHGMMGAIIFDHSAIMDIVVRQQAERALRDAQAMAESVGRAQG